MTRVALSVLLAGTVAGCAALPRESAPLVAPSVSVKDIVVAVQCELAAGYNAAGRNSRVLDKFAAAVSLDLQVKDTSDGSVGLVLAIPHAGAMLGVTGAVLGTDTSYRQQTLDFEVRFDELKAKPFPPDSEGATQPKACNAGDTGFSAARATLGVTPWLMSTLGALGASDDAANLTKIGYLLSFTLVRSANGGFTVMKGHVANARLGASASRTDTHILNISVARIKDYEPWEAPRSRTSPNGKRSIPQRTREDLDDGLRRNRLNSIIAPGARTLVVE
jgi:hypothetical protein